MGFANRQIPIRQISVRPKWNGGSFQDRVRELWALLIRCFGGIWMYDSCVECLQASENAHRNWSKCRMQLHLVIRTEKAQNEEKICECFDFSDYFLRYKCDFLKFSAQKPIFLRIRHNLSVFRRFCASMWANFSMTVLRCSIIQWKPRFVWLAQEFIRRWTQWLYF